MRKLKITILFLLFSFNIFADPDGANNIAGVLTEDSNVIIISENQLINAALLEDEEIDPSRVIIIKSLDCMGFQSDEIVVFYNDFADTLADSIKNILKLESNIFGQNSDIIIITHNDFLYDLNAYVRFERARQQNFDKHKSMELGKIVETFKDNTISEILPITYFNREYVISDVLFSSDEGKDLDSDCRQDYSDCDNAPNGAKYVTPNKLHNKTYHFQINIDYITIGFDIHFSLSESCLPGGIGCTPFTLSESCWPAETSWPTISQKPGIKAQVKKLWINQVEMKFNPIFLSCIPDSGRNDIAIVDGKLFFNFAVLVTDEMRALLARVLSPDATNNATGEPDQLSFPKAYNYLKRITVDVTGGTRFPEKEINAKVDVGIDLGGWWVDKFGIYIINWIVYSGEPENIHKKLEDIKNRLHIELPQAREFIGLDTKGMFVIPD